MISRRVWLLFVLIVLAATACKSGKRSAYEVLADRINPLLIRLVPTITALHAVSGDSDGATSRVIAICQTADEALSSLRDVREDDGRIQSDYDSSKPYTSEVARWLLDRRTVYCRSPNGDPLRPISCRDWCRDSWRLLVEAAGRLRVAAGKAGVEIVEISPQ